MGTRRVPAQQKKLKGTFNVTRDKDTEFILWDGQVRKCPEHPEDFNEMMIQEWQIVWKHLIKHEYGKDADYRLVEIYIRSMADYFKYQPFDHTYTQAIKAWGTMRQASEMLGVNPASMSKVAALQKQKKGNKLNDLLENTGT